MKLKYKLIPLSVCIALSMSGCALSGANRNYSKALSAYEDNDYTKAQEYFVKAIDANIDKAEYHIDYGFDLIALKEYEKAREQLQYVIMDKDIPMVRENNKKAYRGIGISYLFEGNYDAAIENFNAALEISDIQDLDTDIMYYKASALEKTGANQEAIELYTSILTLKPEDSSIYNARANQYRLIGDYESSIADFDKAIELAPDNFNFYTGKFATLKENNKNAEATAVLEQAAALKINDDSDKFELAKVHFYQGNYDLAMNELTSGVDLGFTQGYYFIGEIYVMNEDYSNAINNFNQYIDAGNGVSGMLYNQMLTCYLQLKDFDQAKTCLEKAKKLSDASMQNQLAKNEIVYYEQTGNFEEALACMENYLKTNPEDSEAKKDYYFLTTRMQGTATEDEVESPTTPQDTEPAVVKP